jgi:hypothetical protein
MLLEVRERDKHLAPLPGTGTYSVRIPFFLQHGSHTNTFFFTRRDTRRDTKRPLRDLVPQ